MNEGIRVELHWNSPANAVWIDPMPCLPRPGDGFNLCDIVGDNLRFVEEDVELSEKEWNLFYMGSFDVYNLSWQRDKEGYFVRLIIGAEDEGIILGRTT
jgi:hypothetical protein